jgi:hypothetical protein
VLAMGGPDSAGTPQLEAGQLRGDRSTRESKGALNRASAEGTRRTVQRRSVKCRLEAFRAARGIHQSEARARRLSSGMRSFAAAFGYWTCLLEGGRVHCRHRNQQRWGSRVGRGAAQAIAPASEAAHGNQVTGGVSFRSHICRRPSLGRHGVGQARHPAQLHDGRD